MIVHCYPAEGSRGNVTVEGCVERLRVKALRGRVTEVEMARKFAVLIFAALFSVAAARANNSTAGVPAFYQLKNFVGGRGGRHGGGPVESNYNLVADRTPVVVTPRTLQ